MGFGKKLGKEMFLELIIFCLGVASISIFFTNNVALSLLLILIWVAGIKFWHKKHDVYFFVSGAFVGTVAEIICIHFGVWQYANPTIFGIPMWLPLAWGFATMLIKRIAETFVKIEGK